MFPLKEPSVQGRGQGLQLTPSLAEPCDPEPTPPAPASRTLHGSDCIGVRAARVTDGSSAGGRFEELCRRRAPSCRRRPPRPPRFPRTSLVFRLKALAPGNRRTQGHPGQRVPPPVPLTVGPSQLRFHSSRAYASIRRRLGVLAFAVGRMQARQLRLVSRVPLPALARARTEKWASL